jgi:hypothetical protein
MPEKSVLTEEAFLIGQRHGLRVRQPFWDTDLVEFLVRVRSPARTEAGFAKALVRRPLVRRFPRLGFDRRPKSNLGFAYRSVISAQADAARQAIGGIQALGELGVVDAAQLNAVLDDALTGSGSQRWLWSMWDILSLEAWARAHG